MTSETRGHWGGYRKKLIAQSNKCGDLVLVDHNDGILFWFVKHINEKEHTVYFRKNPYILT